MFPDLFRIPFIGYPVHSYGLMLVIGLIGGIELMKFLARRSQLNPEYFANAAVLALVSGLIGARIAYVVQFHEEFSKGTSGENIWNAINLTSGGLVYYGGFLLAFPTLVAYAIWKKLPLLRGMDIVAPSLMIGLAFGRVGCFLNGCCYGQTCDLPSPIAVSFPYGSPAYEDDLKAERTRPPAVLYRFDPVTRDAHLLTREQVQMNRDAAVTAAAGHEHSTAVLNTQLISTVTASMIALAAFAFYTLGKTPGRGFAVMMMLEGLSRFLIEGLRVEPNVLGPLTLSQLIGLGVALGGVSLWIAAGLAAKRRDGSASPVFEPSPATA